MAENRNRLILNARGGEAQGRFAIAALILATTIRWVAVVWAAQAVSSLPVKALVAGLLP
jgi:hypothetical protein